MERFRVDCTAARIVWSRRKVVDAAPRLAPVFTAINGAPAINYLKTYIQPNLTQTMLALDSAGTLWGAEYRRWWN